MRTAPHHAAPGTAAGRRSSARSSRIAAVLAAGLLLPGCTLIGSLSPGSWEPDPEAWVHDESAGRYYQLAALSDDPARWAEEFPQYADSPGTWIAGPSPAGFASPATKPGRSSATVVEVAKAKAVVITLTLASRQASRGVGMGAPKRREKNGRPRGSEL